MRWFVFLDRVPALSDGTEATSTDPIGETIEGGERREVGAVTITRTGEQLAWFNIQHNPTDGILVPGENITFDGGERLGFFSDEAAAGAYLERCIETDLAVLRDLECL